MVDPTSQAGTSRTNRALLSCSEATAPSATTPATTKKKNANSPWSATDPTSIRQARL
jgi:hypothetical protein